MSTTTDLAALIHQLRGASKLQRLKLLTLAWRQLRALSAYDLKMLAREAGIEGFERLLEELRDRKGVNPARLLRAIDQAVNADPSELREVLHEVTAAHPDPEQAHEAKAVAQRWLDEVVGPPEHLPEHVVAEASDSLLEPEPAVQPISSTSAPPAPEPEPEPAPGTAPASQTGSPGALSGSQSDGPGTSVSERTAGTPPAADSRERQLDLARASVHAGGNQQLAEQLEAAPTARQKLQVVHRWVEGDWRLDTQDLVAALMTLPGGWVRRRALAAVLRAGVPADLDAACDLIEAVAQSFATRLWAYTELARRVSDQTCGADVLLAAKLPAPLRRRLQNRLHVGNSKMCTFEYSKQSRQFRVQS